MGDVANAQIDEVEVNRPDRGEDVDQYRKKNDQDCDQDFRINRESHPENEQGCKRDFGRDLQRQNIGREGKFGCRRHSEEIADGGAQQAADDETSDDFAGRDAWLRSGMEVGVDQGYAKLERMIADGAV